MQVTALGAESKRLEEIHKDQADTINAKQNEIEDNWERLKEKGAERKSRLDDSYHLHRYLADFRDLVSWMHDMKAIISADDLAKDVAGAEALLDRHQEHKVNMYSYLHFSLGIFVSKKILFRNLHVRKMHHGKE